MKLLLSFSVGVGDDILLRVTISSTGAQCSDDGDLCNPSFVCVRGHGACSYVVRIERVMIQKHIS